MSLTSGIDRVYRLKSGRGLRLEQHKSADGLRKKCRSWHSQSQHGRMMEENHPPIQGTEV